MDPELIQVVIDRALIEADCLVVFAQADQSLHGQGLPVRQRRDRCCVLAEVLHAFVILLLTQQTAGVLHTVGEELLVAHGLAHSPDIAGLHGKELTAVLITGLQIAVQLFFRIALRLRVAVELLELAGVLHDLDLVRPVEDVLFRDDVVDLGQSCLLEILLCIINNAAQGMVRIVDVAVAEEKLLQAVARNTLLPRVDEDLQKGIILGDRGLG